MASSRAQSLLKPGGSSEALSVEDMRMVLNWEKFELPMSKHPGSKLNWLAAH